MSSWWLGWTLTSARECAIFFYITMLGEGKRNDAEATDTGTELSVLAVCRR